MGKTIGIIGYGNMGQAFAKRLSGFSCRVLAYDKYKKNFSDPFATQATLEDLMKEVDILSLHIPLTAETHDMVTVDFLEQFKKRLIFVNTARGELVSLTTLATAVKSGRLRGAVLDVLENEKLTLLSEPQREAFNYLRSQHSVLFTPHIAGWTFESHYKINQILVQKLQALGFGSR